ncbi:hypothetical protein RvY_09413 [Ramazzottius varieornatus]|uniref:Uncharacterized protein n=1 Tax=Ramazzottius varieornatus TaxID=947166 RepID=A0A1D1VIC9_RAMVA|nr:hypothetical protein RvY_09413 [Ramazzottius varieornatus]
MLPAIPCYIASKRREIKVGRRPGEPSYKLKYKVDADCMFTSFQQSPRVSPNHGKAVSASTLFHRHHHYEIQSTA